MKICHFMTLRPTRKRTGHSRLQIWMLGIFKESYRNFLPTQKWRLPGGSTVEDTLYSTYWTEKSPRVRNLIVNWVVDLNDKTMEGMLTREDWEAISSWAVIF
jgi:hypothetical protein